MIMCEISSFSLPILLEEVGGDSRGYTVYKLPALFCSD